MELDLTYKMDTLGNILNTYPSIPEYELDGIAWDGEHLWIQSENETNKVDTATFEILECIDLPGHNWRIGATFDGEHLWMGSNYTDSLYQIEINQVVSNNDLISQEPFDEVRAIPTPFKDTFHIENIGDQAADIMMYNTLGQEQQITTRRTYGKIYVDGSQLEKGIYFILIRLQSGEIRKLKTVKD